MEISLNTIRSIIRRTVDRQELAGANVLILQDGKELFYDEYGIARASDKSPLVRDTIFRLYSQTKPITAAAVILLAAEGKIDLSADLSEYLPEFSHQFRYDENGEKKDVVRRISVKSLLNMTSGIPYPNYGNKADEMAGGVFDDMIASLYTDSPLTTRDFSEKMAKIGLSFEPESHFRYGAGADIAGALVERVSGVSFGEFLRSSFFEPLEMTDTDFWVPPEKQHRLAAIFDTAGGLHECPSDHLGLRYARDVRPAFESGGAGLCSTLDDYSHFALMLLDGGVYKGRRIMPSYAVRYLTENAFEHSLCGDLLSSFGWMNGYRYGDFMRICDDPSKTALFSAKGEYG
ncbi:MAG: beta-lactamase family protein, partial [Oscillospiraceae bacterium]|nr:beta-lactamase family protein [Oscillospiraceae bacterium]